MSKRRGRPRHDGVERGETGRIKTAAYVVQQSRKSAQAENDARALGRWRAARAVIEALYPDTRLTTPIGRMFLLGVPLSINEAEFEAGTRFEKILARYDRLFLGVGRSPKAQDITAERGSSLTLGPDPEVVADAVARFKGVEAALLGVKRATIRLADGTTFELGAGADLFGATKALVLGEDWEARAAFGVVGLKALARFWTLDQVPTAKIRRWGQKLAFTRENRVNAFDIQYGD